MIYIYLNVIYFSHKNAVLTKLKDAKWLHKEFECLNRTGIRPLNKIKLNIVFVNNIKLFKATSTKNALF